MICPKCGKEVAESQKQCDFCSFVDEREVYYENEMRKARRNIRFTNIAAALFILAFALLVLISANTPCPVPQKSRFTACYEQLSHIKSGIEQYLTENGKLSGIDPYGDAVCNYVVGGYVEASQCKGQIAKRVMEVCADYRVIIVDAKSGKYEISGHAKDKKNCGIMVNEMEALPKKYDDCTPEIPKGMH